MFFHDGVSVDQYGFFVSCPKCGNTKFTQKSQKCSVCGTSRRNYCIPADKSHMPHANAVNARYCEACGAETILFHYGALKKWEDAADELKNEARHGMNEPAELPF